MLSEFNPLMPVGNKSPYVLTQISSFLAAVLFKYVWPFVKIRWILAAKFGDNRLYHFVIPDDQSQTKSVIVKGSL